VGCGSQAAGHISTKSPLLKPFNTLYKTAVICWVIVSRNARVAAPARFYPLPCARAGS